MTISFCIPIYNEATILESFIQKIDSGLEKHIGKNNYEIIIVDNGSTDETPNILKTLQKRHIHTFTTKQKGIGIAYKKAITHAKGEFILLSAIDLPFGFSDIKVAQKYFNSHDLIFGSKAHINSKVFIPFQRKVASIIYRFFLHLFFSLNIQDTQGSIFIKRKKLPLLLPYLSSPNAFFTAQIAIYGLQNKLMMLEIPVTHVKHHVFIRNSKYNILTDGIKMFDTMVKEYLLVKKRANRKAIFSKV